MKVFILFAVLAVSVNSFSLRENIRREFDHAERMIDHLGEFVKENVNTGLFRNLITFKERLVNDVLKVTGLMRQKSAGACTKDVLRTLPNGDVVYVRKNVCNDIPTENNVETTTNLPAATYDYSTVGTTTKATTPNHFTTINDYSTEGKRTKPTNPNHFTTIKSYSTESTTTKPTTPNHFTTINNYSTESTTTKATTPNHFTATKDYSTAGTTTKAKAVVEEISTEHTTHITTQDSKTVQNQVIFNNEIECWFSYFALWPLNFPLPLPYYFC